MAIRSYMLGVVGASALALLLALPFYAAARDGFAGIATPAGITLQELSGASNGFRPGAREVIFGNAEGLTLYTSDKDVDPGKSACVDACLTSWKPLLADSKAKADGAWTVIKRADGARQWALHGKPLYTFVGDKNSGDAKGTEDAGWKIVKYDSLKREVFPFGIGLQPVSNGEGEALVDLNGMTLYTSSAKGRAKTCAGETCAGEWTALAAPELAQPVGNFTIHTAADGGRQWAFKGQPLFTYSGDLAPGDVEGERASPDWHAAIAVKYFNPREVTLQYDPGYGPIFADASGKTLYAIEQFGYSATGRRSTPDGNRGQPKIGKTLGTGACESDCLRDWIPFRPSANAQPSGYWEIMVRSDGSRQWSYRGYAVYTHREDQKPGEMRGHGQFNFIVASQEKPMMKTAATAVDGAAALYWRAVTP